MTNFPSPKAQARILKTQLATRGFKVNHQDALEIVSNMLGFKSWQICSAQLAERSLKSETALQVPDKSSVPQHNSLGLHHIVEYNLGFFGGDYSGTVTVVLIPEEFSAKHESIEAAFTAFTGHDSKHIVCTNDDERVKYVRFYDIEWELDDADRSGGMPSEIVLEVPLDLDVAEEGADLLSDRFGYCVKTFHFDDGLPETSSEDMLLSEQELADLGYCVDEDTDQPGMYFWRHDQEGSGISYSSKTEAIEAASENAFATYALHRCDNCGKIHSDETLQPAQDLHMRLDPGGVVPSGECADCGALC